MPEDQNQTLEPLCDTGRPARFVTLLAWSLSLLLAWVILIAVAWHFISAHYQNQDAEASTSSLVDETQT